MKLKILFGNDQDKIRIKPSLRRAVRKAAEKTLEHESFGMPTELSVTFTDNDGIQALNRKFRDKDSPTDVLSFPIYSMEEDDRPIEGETAVLGDIVISLERVAVQAEEVGNSFLRETAFLTVHSVLHLLGYDHETSEEDEKRMIAIQKEIMNSVNVK